MALPKCNQQPAPKPVYSRVGGSNAATMASPQPVARRGNNPGAIAARTLTPTPNTAPGKVLAVYEPRAAAGLFRQVRFIQGRAHVEGAPLVRHGSGFGGGLMCGGGIMEVSIGPLEAAGVSG